VLPLLEKGALYEKMTGTGTGQGKLFTNDPETWFLSLPAAEQNDCAVATYRCPSSNGGQKVKVDASGSSRGPVGDYILPSCTDNNITGDYWSVLWRYNDLGSGAKAAKHRLTADRFPLRIAVNKEAAWEPRETFDYWSDGLTNVIAMAEKHIPSWALSSNSDNSRSWNGSWLCTKDGVIMNVTRYVTNNAKLIATSPSTTDTPAEPAATSNANLWDAHNQPQLGSSHPSMLNVGIGDGSVRGIRKNVLPELIRSLVEVNDGVPVSLP
jgi:hypothetical protein